MIEVVVAVAVGAALTAGAVWARPRLSPSGWLDRMVAERVIVHTSDGTSIEGVIRERGADGVVLTAARLLDGEVNVGGDVWIPRSKVHMVQRSQEI